MKIPVQFIACAICLLAVALTASARAAIIAQHSGQTSPVDSEGFDVPYGTDVGEPVDDGGVDAWKINSGRCPYRIDIAAGTEEMYSEGWTASMDVRLGTMPYDGTKWGATLEVNYKPAAVGNLTYMLCVGADEEGNPTLFKLNNYNTFVRTEMPLTGISGSGYHTYEMRMDPLSTTAKVYVDDLYQGDIAADTETLDLHRLNWGAQGGTADNAEPYYASVLLVSGALPMVGDANDDGRVDSADAALLAANWLKTGGATWGEGDFNKDGNVDDIDATLLAANWQQADVSQSVTEPGAIVLALAGIICLLIRKRPTA